MSVEIIQGDALALPLDDASVDLIVTSPPYSDADLVQFLCPQEALLQSGCHIWVPLRGMPSGRPDRQVRRGDEHLTRACPDMRHVALTNRLKDGSVVLAQPSRGFSHGHHGLTFHYVRNVPPAPTTLLIDLRDHKSVLRLHPLDAEVGQQRGEDRAARSRMYRPYVKRPASAGSRVAHHARAAEHSSEQIDRVWLNLLDLDACGVDRLTCVTSDPHGVGAAMNADVSVRVDDSRRVREIGGAN